MHPWGQRDSCQPWATSTGVVAHTRQAKITIMHTDMCKMIYRALEIKWGHGRSWYDMPTFHLCGMLSSLSPASLALPGAHPKRGVDCGYTCPTF